MKTVQKTTRTTEVRSYSAADIREALGLPQDARMELRVPSGGDYSGEHLGIDEFDGGLVVTLVQEVTDAFPAS